MTLVIVACGSSKVWRREPGRGPTPARERVYGAAVPRQPGLRGTDGRALGHSEGELRLLPPEQEITDDNIMCSDRGSVDAATLQRQGREQG
jgi:hypothetical protein